MNSYTKVFIVLFKLIALLPLSAMYRISDLLYIIIRYVAHYRKGLIRNNIKNSFPEMTAKERERIEKRFYHHLCDCIMETIKLLHISDKEMGKRVQVKNVETIERIAAEGKPIIVFLGHYGNWEWVQEITKRYKNPTISGEIYRPLGDKKFNTLMTLIRSRYNTLLIPQKKAARTIINLQKEHSSFLIGFISDQRPTGSTQKHWTTFLNQDSAFAGGAEEIGRHIGAEFIYLDVEKPSRGHYLLTVKEIDIKQQKQKDDKYSYTMVYINLLEETIRRAPEYWLWSHDRWKHQHKKN